jgi:hypothetical protein
MRKWLARKLNRKQGQQGGPTGKQRALFNALLAVAVLFAAIVAPALSTTSTPSQSVSETGVRGSAAARGCGDGLWRHVYNPTRLLVKDNCMTVTGVIVDATAKRFPDGVVHAADGDAHGWLKVDPPFAHLVDSGDVSYQGGNLVFEVICHFATAQASAKPACAGFNDHTTIPPVGSHVAVTGSLVHDTQRSGIGWNEIHPVSSIKVQ